jgi:hypothetical protein
MFLSLPHSLLALVICLLETPRALAASRSPSPTAHFGNVGDYVASGLGIENGSTTTTQNTAPPAVTTGTGQEYASSCASALSTWSSSSFSWQWANAIVTTSTFSSGFTETLEKPGTTKVTSLVTLCDGHPRVVGYTSVSTAGDSTSTVTWTNTITQSLPNYAYPTPPPCSIQPSDCKTLSRSYESWLSKQLAVSGFATVPAPMCTIEPSSSYSYSTNKGGQTCDNCMIAASTARVMFWPVTTAAGGNLCNKTGATITASPTGPPNSFVTEGITITSPTVAVSLAYMSRVDGCGTTINHTIIQVHPDQVSSVRGFRALFSHHRFNFADLNYFCENTNTTTAIIAEGQGDSCYQQVPAEAYFGGLNVAVVYDQAPFRNLSKADMTIWDDYQPQLLPPRTMTEAITSIWGNDCIIHPDGVWDPPIALTPEASLILPTLPVTTDSSDPGATPASPINSYGAVPPRQTGINTPTLPAGGSTSAQQHFTALPETGGYGGDGGSGGSGSGNDDSTTGQQDGSASNGGDENSSGRFNGANGQGSQGASGNVGGSNGNSGSGSNGGSNGNSGPGSNGGSNDDSGSGNNGGSQDESGSGNGAVQSGTGQSNQGGVTRISVHTTVVTVGNKIVQCTQDSNGAWVIPDITTTHTASVEVDGATLTAGPNGLVNVGMQNTVITIGNKVLTGSQDPNGAWIIPDTTTTHTASAGGSIVQIDGVALTAGADGLVNVGRRNSILTVGNKVLTGSQDANGAWVIPDAPSTHTVSQGGSAAVVDGVTVTAASEGIVNAHASGTGGSSDDSAEESGTGTRNPGATQTSSAQATSATTTDSNSAGTPAWSPAILALALLSMYICAL